MSGQCAAEGGGGGRGGVRIGGGSMGSGFCVSRVVKQLVFGRLWVRTVMGPTVDDSV